jgi:hypothetical protein
VKYLQNIPWAISPKGDEGYFNLFFSQRKLSLKKLKFFLPAKKLGQFSAQREALR